jgi:ankyrin repeat protein
MKIDAKTKQPYAISLQNGLTVFQGNGIRLFRLRIQLFPLTERIGQHQTLAVKTTRPVTPKIKSGKRGSVPNALYGCSRSSVSCARCESKLEISLEPDISHRGDNLSQERGGPMAFETCYISFLREARAGVCISVFLIALLSDVPQVSGQETPNKSPRERLDQYVTELRKNPSNDALRWEIIRLGRILRPAVPGEAEEYSGQAEALMRNIRTNKDYLNAAAAYRNAIEAAPWVADNYYNRGIALENAAEGGNVTGLEPGSNNALERFPAAASESFRWYLLAAPEANDAAGVRRHIGHIAAKWGNFGDTAGWWNPVDWAASWNDLEGVRAALDDGVDPNKKGAEALRTAARKGSIEIVRLLLDHAADPRSEPWGGGHTVLGAAADSGNPDLIELLIRHGADVNQREEYDSAPLLTAAYSGSVPVLQVLLSHGANTHVRDSLGNSPISEAVESGNFEAVKLLVPLDREDINLHKLSGTPLFQAIFDGRVDIAQFLLANGANIPEDSLGAATYSYGKNSSRLPIVQLLVSHGAKVREKDENGHTALHYASSQGDLSLVRFLVEHGADVNAEDNAPLKTPLQLAIYTGHLEVIEYLVAHGANLNQLDGQGRAPLQLAEGHKAIADFLRSHGAH